jgi:hypothetical protein
MVNNKLEWMCKNLSWHISRYRRGISQDIVLAYLKISSWHISTYRLGIFQDIVSAILIGAERITAGFKTAYFSNGSKEIHRFSLINSFKIFTVMK